LRSAPARPASRHFVPQIFSTCFSDRLTVVSFALELSNGFSFQRVRWFMGWRPEEPHILAMVRPSFEWRRVLLSQGVERLRLIMPTNLRVGGGSSRTTWTLIRQKLRGHEPRIVASILGSMIIVATASLSGMCASPNQERREDQQSRS
jgi:hypothetical protein